MAYHGCLVYDKIRELDKHRYSVFVVDVETASDGIARCIGPKVSEARMTTRHLVWIQLHARTRRQPYKNISMQEAFILLLFLATADICTVEMSTTWTSTRERLVALEPVLPGV